MPRLLYEMPLKIAAFSLLPVDRDLFGGDFVDEVSNSAGRHMNLHQLRDATALVIPASFPDAPAYLHLCPVARVHGFLR